VFRQFESRLHLHGHQYKLIFVEKKLLDPEQDFSYERYEPEVLIVDGNELVATLSDSVIDRFDLFELARAVEARSDRASRLFGE